MGITQTNALARELLSIIERRTAEKRQADPKLDYGESWRVLASERPDLISAYNRAAGARPKADCRSARSRCHFTRGRYRNTLPRFTLYAPRLAPAPL